MMIKAGTIWRQIDKGSERLVKVLVVDQLTLKIVGCDEAGNEIGRPTRTLVARFEHGGYAGPGRRASGGYVPYQDCSGQIRDTDVDWESM